jgi:FKBP-type peptidyl-prolyl cis-trans isomerase FkpA
MAFTTTASGLQYEDTVVGTGTEAKPAVNVTVHYTGWLYVDGAAGREVRLQQGSRRALHLPARQRHGDQGLGRGRAGHEGGRPAHA